LALTAGYIRKINKFVLQAAFFKDLWEEQNDTGYQRDDAAIQF